MNVSIDKYLDLCIITDKFLHLRHEWSLWSQNCDTREQVVQNLHEYDTCKPMLAYWK